TDPTSGMCTNPTTPGASATVQVAGGGTVTLSTFVTGQGTMVPYDPANNRIYVIGNQGGTPVGEASAAVKMVTNGTTLPPPVAPPSSPIYAAVAPNARTTSPGTAVTAFATIVNASQTAVNACSIALPSGIQASFSYQTTDPATNTPVGTPNAP